MQYLKEWELTDAPALAEAINNPEVQKNLRDGIPYPYTVGDGESYIQSALSAPPDSQYVWAIQWEGRVIGSLGLFRKENIHRRTAELGYYIAEPYWGRGITARAVEEACRYVFENTDLLRLFAEPFACNAASCRVLEKAGFVFEGLLRANAVKNGAVIDMKLYALLR